ncbi:tyrosine-protein kinase RYK-like isoform X2 [Biomphalaria glabrata]|uniref:receptor protein-tyrosine kinase n=1 Tax=Biomphalaria glabrata TaxID=6526 RepID=A0A2C9M512_BIOGL|nr:tyrosine-protein kinase RYK-like isoform X2 [Biomphalaria glabrata]
MLTLYIPRILLWCACLSSASGYLNLYLSPQETLRLLGVEYELYYVRNGIINQYALSFDLPLQSHIDEIYFNWQNLRDDPPMFYKMNFNVSNRRAMNMPSANISENGEVPRNVSVFKVSLPCTGQINAEVHITIQISISLVSAANPPTLLFKRKKVCLKKNSSFWVHTDKDGINKYQFSSGNSSMSTHLPDPESEEKSDLTTSTHFFYAAVACTCAVIILIALGVTVYYLNSQRGSDSRSSSSQALTGQSQTFLRPDTPNNASGSGASTSFRRGVSPSIDLKSTDINTVLSDILIDRKKITLVELLHEGTFGRIYMGTLLSDEENETGTEQDVFIKTVTDQAKSDQVQLFLTESVLLKSLIHPNLHSILGACLESPDQPLVVYPYLQEGNMKKFLLKCRMSECGSRYTLNTQQLVYMAIQIIRGIQYLHRKKLIHKDIATRNCIVGTDLVVKVTDNSLARDLFPGDYNCLGDNENRPVKWMAIEALMQKRFSPASDVWAFGVTLWEMMTLGQQPYAEVDPFEMTAYLQEGYRIAKPHNCPDELFSLMACCWALCPDERPKFPQLLTYLQNFYMALGRYI